MTVDAQKQRNEILKKKILQEHIPRLNGVCIVRDAGGIQDISPMGIGNIRRLED